MKPLQLAKPRILIVTGIPASGKSGFAEHFAGTFKAPFFEPSKLAAAMLPDIDSQDLIDELLEQFLRTGKTIVYETTSGTKQERLRLSKLARSSGYEPLVVWVQTDAAVAKVRALKRKKGSTSYSEDEFMTLLRKFTPPSAQEDHIVISGMHTHASQAKAILRRLTAVGGRGPGAISTPDARQKSRSAPRLVQ